MKINSLFLWRQLVILCIWQLQPAADFPGDGDAQVRDQAAVGPARPRRWRTPVAAIDSAAGRDPRNRQPREGLRSYRAVLSPRLGPAAGGPPGVRRTPGGEHARARRRPDGPGREAAL